MCCHTRMAYQFIIEVIETVVLNLIPMVMTRSRDITAEHTRQFVFDRNRSLDH